MQEYSNKPNSQTPKKDWKTFHAKALVAEDNPANQKLIKVLLEKHGLEVALAENGRQALEAARDGLFDIIFMDMQMPVMNGYEATQSLREQGVKTPIVALTANAMVGDCEKCLQAGCNSYLSKPINRKLLQDIIETSLASPLEEKIDTLNDQTQQLNKLINGTAPTTAQTTSKKDEMEG